MAGKIDQVVVVELSKDTRYHKKGTHAMNKTVAEKLKKQDPKLKITPAKEVVSEIVARAKENLAKAEEAQEKANKGK